MTNCIIIEDQAPAQKILKRYIEDTPHLKLNAIFSDAIEANAFLEKNSIDLIFLDIHLPKITGIDFLKSLKDHPYIILTTAFSEYALESYKYNVVDYLLKPFSFERYKQAITKYNSLSKASFINSKEEEEPIYIKYRNELIKLEEKDIIMIKSDADYTEIITVNKKYLSSYKLKVWVTKLSHQFCQVHKSYIINSKHLIKLTNNKIYLYNDLEVPIGRAYKKDFIDNYISNDLSR